MDELEERSMGDSAQTLVALEQAWLEAIQRKDMDALARIIGDDYAYTATGHGRRTRQEWMEAVPYYDIHNFTIISADVRVYGDAAVVLPHVQQTATFGDATRSGNFLITDVWLKREGTWRVVARSSILTPSPAEDSWSQ